MSSHIWVYIYQCIRSLISLPPLLHVHEFKIYLTESNNTTIHAVLKYFMMKPGGKYLITQYSPVLPFLWVLPSWDNPGFPRAVSTLPTLIVIRNRKTRLAWYRILYFCVGNLLVDTGNFRRYIIIIKQNIVYCLLMVREHSFIFYS